MFLELLQQRPTLWTVSVALSLLALAVLFKCGPTIRESYRCEGDLEDYCAFLRIEGWLYSLFTCVLMLSATMWLFEAIH